MTTELITKEQLLEQPWATEYFYDVHEMVAVQHDSIINWYAFSGFECPVDGTVWSWKYKEPLPAFTPNSIPFESHEGFELIEYGHRYIAGTCNGECAVKYYLHNFDYGV